MRFRFPQLYCFVLLLVSVFPSSGISQVSDKISSIAADKGVEGQPLTIRAELIKTVAFDRIVLAYRQFGQTEYKRIEMSRVGDAATATIPARDVQPPFLEYYLLLFVQGASNPETYPMENPEDHPLRIILVAPEDKDSEILVLSPERGERLTKDELVVSISLLRTSPSVDRKRTRVFVDTVDVTPNALFIDELVLIRPENFSASLPDGDHALRIELYDAEGTLYHTMSWPFTLVSIAEAAAVSPVIYSGSIMMESRNETIAKDQQSYNRGSLTASTTYGDFLVRGNLYVTNEEKDFRQPQNRFFIGAESPWAKVGYGDSYPTFPRLIMEGKRLRGFTGNVSVGFLKLDLGIGEVIRKNEGDTIKTFPETDSTSFNDPHPKIVYNANTAPKTWAWFNGGTYMRDLFVVRPSFHVGENVQFGFSYLKSKDDAGSIRFGVKPQENLVLGTDFLFTGFDRKLEVTAQAAFSATNRDISAGNISDSAIARKFEGDPDSASRAEDLKNVRDQLTSFMTVNENIVPLALTNLTTSAVEGIVSLNAFNNYFRFSYMRRGSDYRSFGQDFIRTDIQGFTIFDRYRTLENQLFLSGGFERLQDNLGQTKAATTTYTTFNATVSYYPRKDFPNVTVGYLGASNENGLSGLDLRGSDSLRALSAIDDQSNRIFFFVGYDFVLGARQSAAFNVSFAGKDDQTYRNVDTRNTTVALLLNTTYDFPLQTMASISVNLNKSSRFIKIDSTIVNDFNYTVLLLNGQYRLMQEKLRLSASISPTFGSFRRVAYDASGQYFFAPNLSALLQFGFYQNRFPQNPAAANDVVWTLMVRYDV